MIEFLLGLLCFSVLAGTAITYLGIEKLLEKHQPKMPEIKVDLSGTESRLNKQIAGLPAIITNSITGSANTEKGKLGELIGYLSMKAEYDRIIPLGSIVDFMGIKFPEGDKEGYVHFIDIKTGKNSRLAPDQKKLKALLDKKSIHFKTIRVDEIETQ